MKEAMLRELFRRIEMSSAETETDKELKEQALKIIDEMLREIVTKDNWDYSKTTYK